LIFAFLEAKTSKECVHPVNFSIKDWKSFVSKYWNKENSRLPKLDGDSAKRRWNDNLKKRYKAWKTLTSKSGVAVELDDITDAAWQEMVNAHP
jgi:hypothetical protein